MRVSVFEGAGFWGLTEDGEGANLPPDHGPWRYLRQADISSGDGDRTGLNAVSAIIEINERGFYVYPMKEPNA